MKELSVLSIGRSSKLSNVVEWNQYKVIYKRINGTREEIEVIYDASRQSICVAFTD